MFINYIKIAWRNLVRNKTFSFINIIGLAISLTAFLLMALYIENELSFDRFHVNAKRIYRVADDKQTPDISLRGASSAMPVAPALVQDFPEIEQAARLLQTEGLVKYKEKLFEERSMFYVDANFFKIFSFDLTNGNAENVLKEPGSVVITAKTADKYFGQEEPIGKVISVDGKSMKISGVVKDVPSNSHLDFDFLFSMSTAMQKGSGYDWLFSNWYSNNGYTYVLLGKNADAAKLSAKLPAFDERHREPGSTTRHHYALGKLTDIYLQSDREGQVGKTGNITNLVIFSATAFFILLIACINFINLTTARATLRAKEVGIKKVAGAGRGQMIAQFLTESFLMTTISLLLSLIFVFALLPAFNNFSGKILMMDLFSPFHLISFAILFVLIGLFSGSYPAFVLSGFKPITALKSKLSPSSFSIGLRKGLVIFQFAVSVILIVCSSVVYTQMQFLQKHDLGFKAAQTMVINFEGDRTVQNNLDGIRQRLLTVPGVRSITASSSVPGDPNVGAWSMEFAKGVGDTIKTEFPVYLADYSFLAQYGISMVAGRAFSTEYPSDTVESMLINETAVKRLGFRSPAEAIGLKAATYPSDGKIVGVFKDFHYESLQKEIRPLVIRMIPAMFRKISIELNTADIRRAVNAIENQWASMAPQRPIEYSFLDEGFNKQYAAEIKFGQVFAAFTLLAIIIACLGLFGLALYSVQQRTKEIGIRKVLGASVQSIAILLSKDFFKLVAISCVAAFPIAWWMMSQWLRGYAYRIDLGWPIFLFAALAAITIALITVGYQSINAAIANPVKSLRSE